MFGLCTKKACILVGIITSLLPLLYDIRVDAAPGPHGIMYQYRARIGFNIMGARPGSIEERVLRRDVGYQSEFVDIDAATSADNPAAGAAARAPLDTPPPTLPTRPTSYTTPSLDRPTLSASGRRPPSGRTPDDLRREIKFLEREIDRGKQRLPVADDELRFYRDDEDLSQNPDFEFERKVRDGTGTKRSLPTIKLNTYDGTTPLQTHLSKLDNCAKYYRWSPNDRLCHLKASLTGQAGEVLWQLTGESTEADVVKLLKNRFGSDHQTERYRLELQSRRRQKGESVQMLYNDIRRLLALSFPGESGPMCEVLGMDAFLNSLNDRALRIRVLDQSPKSLDEALVIVSRMEAYSSADIDTDSSASDSSRKKVYEVRAAPADRDDRRLKQLEEDLASQRRQIQQLRADNDFWRIRAERSVPAVSLSAVAARHC